MERIVKMAVLILIIGVIFGNCTTTPTTADGYSKLAERYSSKDDHDSAIANYTEAIRLEPQNPEYYHQRGVEYSIYKKDFTSAIADFTRAIELGDGFSHFGRGDDYLELGEYDKALEDFSWVLQNADLFTYQQMHRAQMGKGRCYARQAEELSKGSPAVQTRVPRLKELAVREFQIAFTAGGIARSWMHQHEAAIELQKLGVKVNVPPMYR